MRTAAFGALPVPSWHSPTRFAIHLKAPNVSSEYLIVSNKDSSNIRMASAAANNIKTKVMDAGLHSRHSCSMQKGLSNISQSVIT